MAVDVADLVESLLAEVNPPGVNLYPDETLSGWEIRLRNAFWELQLSGLITGFTESDGIITENIATPVEDLSLEYQQLIIILAAYNALSLYMLNMNSVFRAKAGPTEYEVQKSATLLTGILDRLQKRFDDIISGLPDADSGSSVYYIDPMLIRGAGLYPYSSFVGF